MQHKEIVKLLETMIYKVSEEKTNIRAWRRLEPIDTIRWNTLVQIERDLKRHLQDLEWTLDYFQSNVV